MSERIVVSHRDDLIRIIEESPDDANLNHIDVTLIEDMSFLFSEGSRSRFNGNISKWNTSNVRNMNGMFSGSKFNGDISNWDTGNVIMAVKAFYDSEFSGNITRWDLGKLCYYKDIFENSRISDEDRIILMMRVKNEDTIDKNIFEDIIQVIDEVDAGKINEN